MERIVVRDEQNILHYLILHHTEDCSGVCYSKYTRGLLVIVIFCKLGKRGRPKSLQVDSPVR